MRLVAAIQVTLLAVAGCAAMTAFVVGTFHTSSQLVVDLLWSLSGFCVGFFYALTLTSKMWGDGQGPPGPPGPQGTAGPKGERG